VIKLVWFSVAFVIAFFCDLNSSLFSSFCDAFTSLSSFLSYYSILALFLLDLAVSLLLLLRFRFFSLFFNIISC